MVQPNDYTINPGIQIDPLAFQRGQVLGQAAQGPQPAPAPGPPTGPLGAASAGPSPPSPANSLLLGQSQQATDFKAQEKQAQKVADFKAALASRSVDALDELYAKYPDLETPLKEAHARLSEGEQKTALLQTAAAAAAIKNGEPQVAADYLRQNAEAIRKTQPERADALDQMAKQIEVHPDSALLTINGYGVVNGGKDWIENQQKVEQGPAALAAKEAEAAKASAEAQAKDTEAMLAADKGLADINYTIAQTKRLDDMTANEAARLGLDTKRLALETKTALAKILADRTSLTEKQQGIATEATLSATAARQSGERSRDVAAVFREEANSPRRIITSGPNGQLIENVADAVGVAGPMTAAKQDYLRIVDNDIQTRAKESGNKLTDTDYAEQRKLYPSVNSPGLVADWLEDYANRATSTAKVEDARAEFVLENGGLGPAKKDIVVGGLKVPKGATYQNVVGALTVKPAAAAPTSAQIETIDDMIKRGASDAEIEAAIGKGGKGSGG